ncbi:HepT-like ribonuclease domain-containing protein [Pelomonas aquatica]|uniref:HepT-like ribonuclease domain-containing protein n=1 Tax=Pelomonas aquatica TaxID=431058 RepID=UPI002407FEEC|nr:HepT-like ribonuclease domain-containing protein [Pelomonas aquatica]
MLLAHMRDCLGRIHEYTNAERARFEGSRLVQDAVIRNLQTLAESSQRWPKP